MAVKQNGVLGTYTPTVTPYTNNALSETHPNNTVSSGTGFPFYTCPGATLASGKLIIANNTGGNVNVDVAIVEQSDIIQFDALASQPNNPSTSASYLNYSYFSFPKNSYVSSIYVEYANLTGTINAGETLTFNNTTLTPNAQTATVHYHDTTNNKIWLRNLSKPDALNVQNTTVTATASGGGTFEWGAAHAGSAASQGHSGIVSFYDTYKGRLFLQNYEFRNNLDWAVLGDMNNENRELGNSNLNRSYANVYNPVATTQTRFASSNSTVTTEFITANGIELLVSGVSQAAPEQYIVRNKQVTDASTLEVGGIVLGTYQSLFVNCSAAVTATFIGFEETAEIPS